ncbi:hypothetical protein COLSTE_01831 [Collinsella stercoris DSM 13279]|uniref:Uncharacterized protein n=1 Tax=Collinsella stercoris DSM 13279 TaxID=445975 RepID=B6GCK8_9ACTN|nr:hypothetical protein COLSTE_01831 [Collinsella stercoris DSM 13279]
MDRRLYTCAKGATRWDGSRPFSCLETVLARASCRLPSAAAA